MTQQEIIEILHDWNLWKKDIQAGVKRSFYLEKLKKMLQNEQIVVITGARRSGKSFIMRQLAKDLVKNGIEKNRILIINFEDPRFSQLNTSLLQKIYKTYLEVLRPQKRPYLFLDEVHEVEKWEKWVLTMHELKKAHITVSGSNAKLLSRELATLLTGRHLDMSVYPLSFREFLQFNTISLKDILDLVAREIEIKGFLMNYFETGAFPEVVLRENKKEILLTYFNDLLEKDLLKRYRVRKAEKLKELLRFYLSNISSLITFRSLEKFLGVSTDTIEKFSNYFTNTYLLFFVKRFSYKIKEQEKSPRKVYAIDPGLANAVGFKFSQNIGRIAENVVFLELLRKKEKNPYIELYYWKDQQHKEVDFVIKEKNEIKQLIQVCWNIAGIKTRQREVGSLFKAMNELKQGQGLIITSDFEGKETIKNKKIIFIPLWKWLFEN
ncbi:ATP-binding protein [Patescibacteria group bacterium AH-259-L07]|nr:ATP-binding protein [Patescibacteria group bacterium AH-259-L07]